ncbi:spore protease YyaC [Neobacillus cucumis]|uniref:Spore protease YyaC n=1 Tax=Neobacillus cucumis TaxID=1740721 RepID=A0A2N5HVA8_9BACI|nr:spore protease YyaC [Neobacillus cucumis]PLS09453.1 spore protease YyaC [Neobacillus cucumis]
MRNKQYNKGESKYFEKVIPFNDRLAPLFIRNTLYSLIPEGTKRIYVVGIGSNVISGDSLGPFVGTLLRNSFPDHLTVMGNLEYPMDATTIVPEISRFSFPKNSFVISIDSVLGSLDFVNSIVLRRGPLQPGLGLGQNLPPIGDCSVMGVVHTNDAVLGSSLLYTSLHLIYTMATNIARGISLAVRQFFHYPSDYPIMQVI